MWSSFALILLIPNSILTHDLFREEDIAEDVPIHDSPADFDMLTFAQAWPETNCIEWRERSTHNTCYLPSKARWTVHGLWPTKKGTLGPNFCNHTAAFDPNQIKDLLPDLEAYWTNVHANSGEFSFWEHEWNKHGTCAAVLPELRGERKYFSMGMSLNKRFPLDEYLSSNSIKPGGSYSYDEIYQAISRGINGAQPEIQCRFDRDTHAHHLAQIEICLDKKLEVISCPGESDHGCPGHGKTITYPVQEIDDDDFILSEDIVYLLMVILSVLLVVVGMGCFARLCYIYTKRRSYSTARYEGIISEESQ